jgi:hypothetical protein
MKLPRRQFLHHCGRCIAGFVANCQGTSYPTRPITMTFHSRPAVCQIVGAHINSQIVSRPAGRHRECWRCGRKWCRTSGACPAVGYAEHRDRFPRSHWRSLFANGT